MVWFLVDDKLATHPKARAAGLPAMGLWAVCGAFAAGNVTAPTEPGFVPLWFVRSWPRGVECAERLVKAALFEARDGGYVFHEWDHIQTARETVQQRREADRERKRRQRLREAEQAGQGKLPIDVTPDVTRDSHVTSNGSHDPHSVPFPSSSKTHLDRAGVSSVTRDPEPPPNCPKHPDGTDTACRACGVARLAHDAWDQRRRADDKRLADERRNQQTFAELADTRTPAQRRAAREAARALRPAPPARTEDTAADG